MNKIFKKALHKPILFLLIAIMLLLPGCASPQNESSQIDADELQEAMEFLSAEIEKQELEEQKLKEELPAEVESPIELVAATVTKHVDGDTVHVTLENGETYSLRMIGVDTPETVHPSKGVEAYGKEASSFTESELLGQTVYLEKDVSETDRYSRLLRYIWLEPPTEINKEEIKTKMFNGVLVANGYAQVSTYPPDVKYQDIFAELSKEAKDQELGLWAETKETIQPESNIASSDNSSSGQTPSTSIQTPAVEEPAIEEPVEVEVLVTRTGKRYHRQACGNGNYYWDTLKNAKARGLTPCQKCY